MRNADPLAHLERAAIGEEIAAAARHDLRNRLGAIRSAAFFLRRRLTGSEPWDADARVPKFFALVDDEIERAVRLVEETRASPAVAHGAGAVTPLGLAVQRARAHARIGDDFDVGAEVEPIAVRGDVDEVALAVRALLENAAEAVGGCGRAFVRVYACDGLGAVEVADDGPGFGAARGDAFRPFFTTKPGHAGLGLCIAARVALRHGGRIEIDDARRAVVRLWLPLHADASERASITA